MNGECGHIFGPEVTKNMKNFCAGNADDIPRTMSNLILRLWCRSTEKARTAKVAFIVALLYRAVCYTT